MTEPRRTVDIATAAAMVRRLQAVGLGLRHVRAEVLSTRTRRRVAAAIDDIDHSLRMLRLDALGFDATGTRRPPSRLR